ncbi:hypothetical protein [Silvanigrella aquatica]|uniref:Uncharacterized protein n=1 Tax=Silvanigrella aquatica TaxID=1915309 RepID=A0A1L4D025_9BACT|nr:hypothetical protein [Silvanigrella aquatica]APJ03548.1 hypothetical protein AXG55_06360 [Silvanigrella aquatica]
MRTFSNRYKIHGVSFHHRSTQFVGRREKSTLSKAFHLDDLLIQIKTESPIALSAKDIRNFLCDQGRNEIHTHVSECTELIAKWSGIVKIMERCFPQRHLSSSEFLEKSEFDDEYNYIHNELEVFLSAKKLLSLWKHRLFIFEMIVEAQDSLRFCKF